MFDGSFKATRKVSLSGRKKPVFAFGGGTSGGGALTATTAASKEELLQQTKRAREERLEHKRRTTASTKIQAVYRRVLTTRRVRLRVFCDVEMELTALLAPTSGVDIRQTPLATDMLQRFLRKTLFATARLLKDVSVERMTTVQDYVVFMLLVSALRGEATAGTSVLTAAKDATWIFQMTKVLERALEVAVTRGTALLPMDQLTNPYVLLLDTLTTQDRYTAAGETSEKAGDAIRKVLRQLALTLGFGSFEALRQLVLNDKGVGTDSRVVQVVTRVVANTLETIVDGSDVDNAVATKFASKILVTPRSVSNPVVRQVMESIRYPANDQALTEGQFWHVVMSSLSKSESLNWSARAFAVGNVLDLIVQSGFSAHVTETGASVLAALITPSHMEWAFDAETNPTVLPSEQADDDDMMEVDMVGSSDLAPLVDEKQRDEAERGVSAMQPYEAIVKEQWQQLCESRFLQQCFEGAAMHKMCDVYALFLLAVGRSHFLGVRQSFKAPPASVFAFLSATSSEASASTQGIRPAIVQSLWKLVKGRQAARPSGQRWVADSSDLQALLLFNVTYSHLLLALDDETFYERSWPFQLSEVNDIVAFLKQFIYDVCWNVSTSVSGGNSKDRLQGTDRASLLLLPTITTAVKLFNQLYDRDCRRRVTVDGAWLWPSMPVIRETVDLESMEGDLFDVQALLTLSNGSVLTPHARASLILTTIPQVFSFNDRVQLFEKLLEEEKRNVMHLRDEFSRAIQIRIKRDEIVEESFEVFQKVCESHSPSVLKSRIKVTFVNAQGLEEAGIDGGGVFKEYVDNLTKNAFSPEFGFFLATNDQLLYPNPGARIMVDTQKDLLDRYRFLGRVLGKALYENILVEPQFAAFFLNKLLGKFNYIDDLHSLDPEMYKSLMQLKHYNGNVEDLSLTFSVSEMEFGQVVNRPLLPNGENIPVTNENRIRYIHLLAHHKLNVLSSAESAAFLRGFRDLIPAKWLQMFSPSELQMLIGGTANNIDVKDWQKNTTYGGGYHPSQRPIQWFWDLVENDFTPDDRAALLKFITSCSRAPLLGFGQLAPQICIHQVRIDDDERLPSSATCMNLLKLPTYSSKEIMKQKLLYAIRSNAGFDLS